MNAGYAVQVRLKVKDWFSIRALPNQIVKVNKRWQLGNSPVALRVNYECPLDNLSNPLRAPARLMVRCGSTGHLCLLSWSLSTALMHQGIFTSTVYSSNVPTAPCAEQRISI